MFELILTCEHGGNQIPQKFEYLFLHQTELLHSHRGFDKGALELAKKLQQDFESPLFFSTISRLLIDLNRSLSNPSLFSFLIRPLSALKKEEIIKSYYKPYRDEVEGYMNERISKKKKILHLSIHTFTPLWKEEKRKGDIGLLYDPKRRLEKEFCCYWQQMLEKEANFHIRRNFPYLGKSDGFTKYLRTLYGENNYLGIELEINQKFLLEYSKDWNRLQNLISHSLKHALAWLN